MRQVATFAVGSAQAGSAPHSGLGPRVLRTTDELEQACRAADVALMWQGVIEPDERLPAPEAAASLCRQAAHFSRALVTARHPFLCFSGDHSAAMGVWGGVMQALDASSRLGLVWIDAHMDAHTFLTTPSGNIHGMPVAALLGQGDRRLSRIYEGRPTLAPQDLILMGVHSFQAQESLLLQRLGVQVIGIERLQRPGALKRMLTTQLEQLLASCTLVGVSVDLDAIDPRFAPGVTVPEPGGLDGFELVEALAGLGAMPEMVGLEIAEYCPRFDAEGRTRRLIADMVSSFYGGQSTVYRSLGSSGVGRRSGLSPMSSSVASLYTRRNMA